MAQLLILADDLSGAADACVGYARLGLRTTLVLATAAETTESDVIAIDTDTRHHSNSAAVKAVQQVLEHFNGRYERLFKKIDSTLRGHVAEELAAVLRFHRLRVPASGQPVAIFAPAYPATGRTTVNGNHLLWGEPLEATSIWRRETVRPHSCLLDLLGQEALKPALVRLADVRSGAYLANAMQSLSNTANVLICDAETDADLQAIVRGSLTLGERAVWVGSAGLAHQLAQVCEKRADSQLHDSPVRTGPTLFVVGTISEVSRTQVHQLRTSGHVVSIEVVPEDLLAGQHRCIAHSAQLERALADGKDVVISPSSETVLEPSFGQRLCSGLSDLVQRCPEQIGALVATGGETARAILQGWGVPRLRLLGELEPGLPLSVTEGWRGTLPVFTKAGAFGGPDSLAGCRHFLRRANRSSLQSFTQELVP